MRVADVMTADVYTTTAEMPLRQLAAELGQHGVSGMPVIADDGRVVGVISEADVLAKARQIPNGDERGLLERVLHPGPSPATVKHDARLVADAMTRPAVTIESYCSVATAASRMLEHGVNRLPVVQRGRLVGIVSRADVVRAFARPDEHVLADVREEIDLQRQLVGEPGTIGVDVVDGEVVLSGVVRRRADAEALPRLVRVVPGVVGVRSELSWSEEQ